MAAVNFPQQCSRARRDLPARRALLVVALLFGLLGMHGLVLSGLPGAQAESAPMSHEGMQAAHAAVIEDGACHGGGNSPGEDEHADPSCASGAVPGSPVLSAPALSPQPPTAAAPMAVSPSYGQPDGARAPPTLEELQLLRI